MVVYIKPMESGCDMTKLIILKIISRRLIQFDHIMEFYKTIWITADFIVFLFYLGQKEKA